MSPKNKFTPKNGTPISFIEYYEKNYNLKVTDVN